MKRMSADGTSRRAFLKLTAASAAGFTLGVHVPAALAQMAAAGKAANAAAAEPAFAPNAFVRVGRDNTVTVIIKHLEMGQGNYTGLPMLVAEEMDAAWSQMRAAPAPADAKLYNNLAFGTMQGTGGSTAMANSFEQLRKAGATARAMLLSAAAQRWNVAADTIGVRDGVVSDRAGHKATFGELAAAAAGMAVPDDVKLKDPKDFRIIGREMPRLDSRAKSNGTAGFTQDVQLPGMLTAVVAHPPRFGATIEMVDTRALKGIPGVRSVIELKQGVAVVATDFWSAKKGRDALKIEWDDSVAFNLSSSQLLAHYRALLATPGRSARKEGDVGPAFAGGAKTLDASFEFPYLAHAAMEPLNCVVKLDADSCEVWNGEQFHTVDQAAVAEVVGLKPEQVKINMLFAGGSFGRRASPTSDYLREAALIAKTLQGNGMPGVPVKLVWTRDDDMRGGYYRPMYVHGLKAALDDKGNIVAWQHRIVGQSIVTGTPLASMIKDGIDPTSVEGASNLPYAIANMSVDLHSPAFPVPVLWWRSVGSTHTAFSTETFIDELAKAAGKDAFEFRRAMLQKEPRHLGVLELAASKSGWNEPLADRPGVRRGRGLALHKSFDTYVAQVAEVSVKPDGSFRVDRVVCAVDCGIVINPNIVRAQMEGAIGFALSAAKYGAITLKEGVVEQSNFHDYQVLRMNEMPEVEVHTVASSEPPTGVGEPGVPPLAPAVANALAAATGQRLRKLPLTLAS